jgi:ribosomal protein S12
MSANVGKAKNRAVEKRVTRKPRQARWLMKFHNAFCLLLRSLSSCSGVEAKQPNSAIRKCVRYVISEEQKFAYIGGTAQLTLLK